MPVYAPVQGMQPRDARALLSGLEQAPVTFVSGIM
jgi:hypothetical protein